MIHKRTWFKVTNSASRPTTTPSFGTSSISKGEKVTCRRRGERSGLSASNASDVIGDETEILLYYMNSPIYNYSLLRSCSMSFRTGQIVSVQQILAGIVYDTRYFPFKVKMDRFTLQHKQKSFISSTSNLIRSSPVLSDVQGNRWIGTNWRL